MSFYVVIVFLFATGHSWAIMWKIIIVFFFLINPTLMRNMKRVGCNAWHKKNCIDNFLYHFHKIFICFPAGSYMLKVNNRKTRTRCEICSKLTIKTPERHHWRSSGVFIVSFEHISHLLLMFLLLTLSRYGVYATIVT